MKKAAIYCRVSTEEQAKEGVSIEAQLAALETWAKLKGIEVVGRYVDDGYSGTTDKRPQLQCLLLDARAGRFDTVLVAKLDRFMRSVKLLHQHLEELTNWRVAFIPLDYPELDTSTSVGKLMLAMLGAIAQFESDRIGDRVKDARQFLKGKGHLSGGRAPYGYTWDKNEKQFVIVDAEANTIKEIYRLYVDCDYGVQRVAEALNNSGLRRRSRRNGHGAPVARPWGAWPVWSILADERYTGKDASYAYPQITLPELFQVAQRKRSHARRIIRNYGAHLLQGRVKCGLCGHAVSPRTWSKNGRRAYICQGHAKAYNLTGSDRCTLKVLEADWLEAEVDDALQSAFATPEILGQHIRQRIEGLEAELRQMAQLVEPLRSEADRLKAIIARVGERYEFDEISRAEYEGKVTAYKAQLREVESGMLPADPTLQLQYRELQQRLENIRALLAGEDWFKSKHTQVWASFQLFASKGLRDFMDKFEVIVWAFPDRIEVRGLIPTQVIERVLGTGCCTSHAISARSE